MLTVLSVILLVIVIVFVEESRQKDENTNAEKQIQVSYTNEIAQKCSQTKNTNEENLHLRSGLVYLYFRSGYPVNDIQSFVTRNNYLIQGEIYSELQGKHSVYLYVPIGEEFCWARELEKEAGVETVRLPSTLRPD